MVIDSGKSYQWVVKLLSEKLAGRRIFAEPQASPSLLLVKDKGVKVFLLRRNLAGPTLTW